MTHESIINKTLNPKKLNYLELQRPNLSTAKQFHPKSEKLAEITLNCEYHKLGFQSLMVWERTFRVLWETRGIENKKAIPILHMASSKSMYIKKKITKTTHNPLVFLANKLRNKKATRSHNTSTWSHNIGSATRYYAKLSLHGMAQEFALLICWLDMIFVEGPSRERNWEK